MNRAFFMPIAVLSIIMLFPNAAFASDVPAAKNYQVGANSLDGITQYKGMRTQVETVTPQTFDTTDGVTGDHSFWIGGWLGGNTGDEFIQLGYFVAESDPSTGRWFFMFFDNTGDLDDWLDGSSIAGGGVTHKFDIKWSSGNTWNLYVDDTLQDSVLTSYNYVRAQDMYAVAELSAPTGQTVQRHNYHVGPADFVWAIAKWDGSVWSDTVKAWSYYKRVYTNQEINDDVGVCPPMGVVGNIQQPSLPDNYISAGDGISCTDYHITLWN